MSQAFIQKSLGKSWSGNGNATIQATKEDHGLVVFSIDDGFEAVMLLPEQMELTRRYFIEALKYFDEQEEQP